MLGAAKGLGWAEVTQLTGPISAAAGVLWLSAAVLVVAAAVLLALGLGWWWVVGAVAAIVSQGAILTSWRDASFGTVANVVLLVAVVYGYASQGPRSYRAEYRRRVRTALAGPGVDAIMTENDLAHLPQVVAAYVRRCGAAGLPHVRNFRARIHGRIRSGATTPWMSFTGEQVNTYGPAPSRLFFMDATMFGLPVDVLHAFAGGVATMRVKVCSLVPMANAAGPEMDRAETVTLFNDLCVLAPAALVDAPITWRGIDTHRVLGTYTEGPHSVSAELVFNDDDDLVDFVSDDRLRASSDGKRFTPQRWSTPVSGYRVVDSRRVITTGDGRWHADDPEGDFTYLEFHLDEITDNVETARTSTRPAEAREHGARLRGLPG